MFVFLFRKRFCFFVSGSPDHSSYVQSFWIDYSDDCCQWKSHPLGEIKCKYKNHKSKSSSKKSLHLTDLNLLQKNEDPNGIYAEVIIWPAITARFVRIRPYSVFNKVAIRMELFGFSRVVDAANLSFARVVTLYDVNESDKKRLMERVKNMSPDTKVIQVDCKAIISAALDRAGLTSVGYDVYKKKNNQISHILIIFSFLKAEADNYICTFTTSGSEASERMYSYSSIR